MRQLRVENTLYNLSDDLWRQVNDLLSKAEGRKQLTKEMLKDEIPLDQPEGFGSGSAEGTGSAGAPTEESPTEHAVEPKPLGEDLSDEEKP